MKKHGLTKVIDSLMKKFSSLMERHGLMKVIGALFLIVVILSFALDGRNDARYYIGLGDTVFNTMRAYFHFFYIAVFLFTLGGFYGVLNKSTAYKKMVEKIANGVKPLGKKYIFVVALVFAVITSFTGITIPLLIFVPFAVAIILAMGYDKLVAVTSTIVSMMVGYMGGVFVTLFNPNTNSMLTFESFVGTTQKFENVIPKLLILFAGMSLIVYYLNTHIENTTNKKVKYELNEESTVKVEQITEKYSKTKVWPLAVVLGIMFVYLIIGLIPWNTLFQLDIFEKFHTWLNELAINDFKIIPNLFSFNTFPFGEWTTDGEATAYIIISFVVLLFTFIASLVSRMKFDDTIDAFADGAKKILPTVFVTFIAYGILVCAFTNGFFEEIVKSYGKFNFAVSGLLTFFGCMINVDMQYIAIGVFSPILNVITDESVNSAVAIFFQGIYAIFSIVGPTSAILIFALNYFDIPYTTWIKYIWRFILYLIILLALVISLVLFL